MVADSALSILLVDYVEYLLKRHQADGAAHAFLLSRLRHHLVVHELAADVLQEVAMQEFDGRLSISALFALTLVYTLF